MFSMDIDIKKYDTLGAMYELTPVSGMALSMLVSHLNTPIEPGETLVMHIDSLDEILLKCADCSLTVGGHAIN